MDDQGFLLLKHMILKIGTGTSLVFQWLRIHLPMQGTQVQSLVQKDPTCLGATKPVHTTTEPTHHVPTYMKPMCSRDHAPQQEKSLQWEAWAP